VNVQYPVLWVCIERGHVHGRSCGWDSITCLDTVVWLQVERWAFGGLSSWWVGSWTVDHPADPRANNVSIMAHILYNSGRGADSWEGGPAIGLHPQPPFPLASKAILSQQSNDPVCVPITLPPHQILNFLLESVNIAH